MTIPILQSAVRALHGVMDVTCASSIRYTSGVSGETYTLPARHEQATGESETTMGMLKEYHAHVFKVTRTNLPVVPSILDHIELDYLNARGKVTATERFDVIPEPGGDHYAPQGNFRDGWKIYTKKVDGS